MFVPLGPSPVPVWPSGQQGPQLIVNNNKNPCTVSASPAPLDGFQLPSGGSLSWPAKTPLFVSGFTGDTLIIGITVGSYTDAQAVATQIGGTNLTTTPTTTTPPVVSIPTLSSFTSVSMMAAASRLSEVNVESDGSAFTVVGGFNPQTGGPVTQTFTMTPDGTQTAKPVAPVGLWADSSGFGPSYFYVTDSDGKVYTFNGSAWTTLSGSPGVNRYYPGYCTISGQTYVSCGTSFETGSEVYHNTLIRYDIAANTKTVLAPSASNKLGTTLVPFGSGKLWGLGGYDPVDTPLATVEIYDIAGNTWSAGPTLPEPMGLGSAAVVSGYLFVFCAPSGVLYRGDGTSWTRLSATIPWNVGTGMRLRALGTNLFAFGGSNTNLIGKATVT